jgi:choline dehydrogenase-like flavoprotein
VPFEPIDFAVRDHVPHSGWPISLADVTPSYDAAAGYLDCGRAKFQAGPIDGWGDQPIRTSQQERWSRRPSVARHLGVQVTEHPRISVLTDAAVTEILLDAGGGTVDGLRVHHSGRDHVVAARTYVLACGGLATSRLLLIAQRAQPGLCGGPAGALGRYYMGHLTGSIAAVVLADPKDFHDWRLVRDTDGTFVRRRFTLSEEAQTRARLLNTSFFLGNLPFADARHANGTLSLFFLALSVPGLGRLLVGADTRRRQLGDPPHDWWAHLRTMKRRPLRLLRDLWTILRIRFLSAARPQVALWSDTGYYALHYHAEQAPNPASRVALGDEDGADGLAGMDVDFRYSDQDVDSVLRAHALLDEQLRATGHGRVVYRHPEHERAAAVRAQARDGYHQIGTTRMSADSADGVVDADCRVHGVDNLFVASSSVFPTAGEANPTFMAVTLAVRLARHLAAVLSSPAGRAASERAVGRHE